MRRQQYALNAMSNFINESTMKYTPPPYLLSFSIMRKFVKRKQNTSAAQEVYIITKQTLTLFSNEQATSL